MCDENERNLHKPWGDNYGYNEGTIFLVSRLISGKGMVFEAWAHKQMSLNLQWLVLRIGGANFFHCWVADSVWLECAESLLHVILTKRELSWQLI